MSNAQRNYLKDFDYRAHGHTASASQFSTYLECPRKWWFQKCQRMPEIQNQQKFIFGDRLHEACERYMLSDETGRDIESGEPYELWPEGWDEGLSGYDAGILRQIVQMGIDEGVLRRTPFRRVEAPFFYTISPNVGICGYRDVAAPRLVEDHKSVKRRKYKATQKKLAKDPQLLLYAGVDIREEMTRTKEMPDPDTEITLRHNQFIKDPDDLFVQGCETTVTVAEVLNFWEEELVPASQEMLSLKQAKKPVNDWDTVEGPRVKGACSNYGGCPFANVCGGVQTPQSLRAQVERINELPIEPETLTTGESNMGIFDRMNKGNSAKTDKPKTERKPQPKVEVEVAPVETAVEETEVETTEVVNDTPPWAVADCAACSGSGFNSNGDACKACDRVTAKNKGIPSAAFEIGVDETGATTWTAGGVEVGSAKLTSDVKVGDDTKPKVDPEEKKAKAAAAKAKRAEKKAAKEAAAKAKAAEAEAAASDDSDEYVDADEVEVPENVEAKATTAKVKNAKLEEVEEVKPGRGRPAMGFFLVYGAVRRSKFPIVDLNQLFTTYANQLAEKQGADSYYKLDRFKRVDLMKSVAEEIAGFIKPGSIVTVRADDRDIKAFASAIEVFATVVIEGNG